MKQCDLVNTNTGAAIVCSDSTRYSKHECEFCRRRDHQILSLCDYPVGVKCPTCGGVKPCMATKGGGGRHCSLARGHGGPHTYDCAHQQICKDCAGTGKRLCNRKFCNRCGANISKVEGYCPDHMERAGVAKPLVREPCYWLAEAQYRGRCLHKGCGNSVEAGDRCLYFPKRKRVMDAECGESYLKLTEGQQS